MTSGARGIAELEVSEDFSIGFRNGIDLIVPQDSNAMAGLGNVPVDILCVLADNVHHPRSTPSSRASFYTVKQLKLSIDHEQNGPP
jgi:hypothetical protein